MNKRPSLLNIHWPEPQTEGKTKALADYPLFALAFRPFFLGAACWAVISVSLWILGLSAVLSLQPGLWHAHEMLFGFSSAVAVGFLLTAAQNWTGLPSLSGKALLLLTSLWLTARFSLLFGQHQLLFWLFILTQLLWWAGAVYSLSDLVLRAKSKNNYLFIPLLSAMALLNLAFIYTAGQQQFALASHLSHSMILLFCILMGLVGGRVIPFFTARALAIQQVKTTRLDQVILLLSVIATLWFMLGFFIELSVKAGWLLSLVGLLHLLRLAGWTPWKIWAAPLLWSLQLAYLALALGLILLGISDLTQLLVFKDVLHLLSISAMAGLILAMMARVSLGHTGRALQVGKTISLAFALLLLAGPVRMVATLSGFPLLFWQASALLWLCAFAIFLWFYLPVLTQPRADGRAG
jgi:uncharacterized protein involved in response to NO